MRHLRAASTVTLISLVWLYRLTLGLWMSGHCRHEPSCSQYAIDALRKYGPLGGLWRSCKRLARCRPWGTRGCDPA